MRWSNISIPEGHSTLLALGFGLHWLWPRRLFRSVWPARILGWPLLLLSGMGMAWAVSAARDTDLSRPSESVVTGPYRFSRNPMYIGWTALYFACAALVNTRWPLLLLPTLVAHLHFFDILREEQDLEEAFGDEYRRYRRRVRRY